MAKKILVVDDEEEILESLYDMLESSGYQLVSAGDGDIALEKIKAEKFDLIILDVVMRNLTGYDVLKGIQKIGGAAAETPVIIMSGKPSMEEVFDRFADPSKHYFLSKPFFYEELLKLVGQLIGPDAVKK